MLAVIALHPIYAGLAFFGACTTSFTIYGTRKTVRFVALSLPVVLFVAILNPLISMSGSTELFRIGTHAIYLESILFGATAAIVLSGVMIWFQSYSACMDSESSQVIFGKLFPTVSLLISYVLRLVPQFVQRGKTIQDVHAVVSRGNRKKDAVKSAFRTMNVLMAWGMQDSIERSDIMKARGYGGSVKRTLYKRYRIRKYDVVLLAVIGVLFALSCTGIVISMQVLDFSFYPYIGNFGNLFLYLPYIAYVCIPLVLYAREQVLWHSYA